MRRIVQKIDISRLLRKQDGATAIEYGLIAAGIAGAIIVTIGLLGGSVVAMWTTVANALS
jgi:pilus assembly protein Flp/PilA